MTPSPIIKLAIFLLLNALFVSSTNDARRILFFILTRSPQRHLFYCRIAAHLAQENHNVTLMSGFPNPFPYEVGYDHVKLHTRVLEVLSGTQDLNGVKVSIMGKDKRLAKIRRIKHPNNILDGSTYDMVVLGHNKTNWIGRHQLPTVLAYFRETDFAVGPVTATRETPNYLAQFKLMNPGPSTYFRCTDCVTYAEARADISRIFRNRRFTVGPLQPQLRIDRSDSFVDPSTDITDFVVNATEGVIYIKFEQKFECLHLGKDKSKIMFEVLSEMPFKVLWKWGSCPVPGKSENIKYTSSLSNDVLAYINVRLAIINPTLSSIQATKVRGVPMLCVPNGKPTSNLYLAADVRDHGFGLIFYDSKDITRQLFTDMVYELMDNISYTRNIESRLIDIRPSTPRQALVSAVKYVLANIDTPVTIDIAPTISVIWFYIQIVLALLAIYGVYRLLDYCAKDSEESSSGYGEMQVHMGRPLPQYEIGPADHAL